MRQSDLVNRTTKPEYLFQTQVLTLAIPVALVILPILWLTGYHPEEWPFISGVFALSFAGSCAFIFYVAQLTLKWVQAYGRTVTTKREMDTDQQETQPPSSNHVRIITALVTGILFGTSCWGLALCVLAFVMAQTEMVPIGAHFPLIAFGILAVGTTGFTLIIGGPACLFYIADRDPEGMRHFSKQLHYWVNTVSDIGKRRNISGVPTLTDSNPLN